MNQFLHKPLSIPEESPGSFVIRCCEQNGYQKLGYFLSGFGFKGDLRTQLSAWFIQPERWNSFVNRLALPEFKNYGYKKAKNYSRSLINIKGYTLQPQSLRLKQSAICPECVEENGYLKWEWDLKLVTSCIKHKRQLVDSCNRCRKALSWYRPKLNYCSCGFNLLKQKIKPSDAYPMHYVHTILHEKNYSSLANLELVYHSLIQLAPIDSSLNQPETVMKLAIDWLEGGSETCSKLHKLVLIKASEGIHPRITLSSFLKFKAHTELNSQYRKLFDGLQRKVSSINPKNSRVSKPLKTSDAIEILGISKFQLKSLIGTGKLKELNNFNVCSRSVNQLLWLFSSGKSPSAPSLFPLSKFIKNPSYGISLATIIQRIIDKKITVSSMDISKGLLSMHISEPEITKPETNAYLTLHEASKLYNAPYESLRKLIQLGILKTKQDNQSQNVVYILRSTLKMLFKRYIFSSQLALEHQVSAQRITAILKQLKIYPKSGPNIDGGLINLYSVKTIQSVPWHLYL